MAHAIQEHKTHAIVLVKLAINETDGNAIADGLNEMLRDHLSEDWLADYALLHTDNPALVVADAAPEEGDLFNQHKMFTICITDAQSNQEWIKVETELDLAVMDERELRYALSKQLVIGETDTICIGNASEMQRIVLSAGDKLKPFHVSLFEDKGDTHTLDFYCLAECEDHADEQALNAYPNGEVRHTVQVEPDDYPYDIG